MYQSSYQSLLIQLFFNIKQQNQINNNKQQSSRQKFNSYQSLLQYNPSPNIESINIKQELNKIIIMKQQTQKKQPRSLSHDQNNFIPITPKYIRFGEKHLNMFEEVAIVSGQKKQQKKQMINDNQLKRLQYLLKINEQKIKRTETDQFFDNYNFTKNMKKMDMHSSKTLDKEKSQSLLDIQKQIIQDTNLNPNAVNMQLIFTTYKTNYRKLDNLKKKFALYQKSKESKSLYQSQHQKKPIQLNDNQQIDRDRIINKLPRINYDFNELEGTKKLTMKNQSKIDQKKHNTIFKVEMYPIKKMLDKINKYSQYQYLNIKQIKPSQKFQFIQSPQTDKIQIPQQSTKVEPKIALPLNPVKHTIKEKSIDYNKKSIISEKKEIDSNKQFSLTKVNFNRKDHFIFGLSKRPLVENKVMLYRDFLWKINMSNAIFIQPDIQLQKPYKIYIGKGNNSMLIKGLIRRRFWWSITDKPNQQANFVWTQLKSNDYIILQKNFSKQNSTAQNYKSQLTTTEGSFAQSEKKKQSKLPKQKQNLKIRDYHENIFSEYDMMVWRNYIQKNKKSEQELNSNVYTKRAILLKNKNAIKISQCENIKIHNHFNSNFFIGNKKALFYSMRKYYQLNKLNVFDYLPLTFHISKGVDGPEYKQFLKVYNNIQQTKTCKNIWIVKPGQFTNRGTGITVCTSLDDIKLRLRGRQKNNNGKLRTFIVQKYLEKPFLYHKRKFDIRHYMMITCINGSFKGYWYDDGYIRTTSYEYNIKNCKDNSIHLTNDAIQKVTQQYGKYEKGNKISYQQFQKYLDFHHKGQSFDFFEMILPKMKKICAQAIRASYFLLDPDRKMHNFQIFGLDFMIDQQFNPWLIQINTNPCLQLSSPLLGKIIPAMVQNAFKIGLDPLFQPPYNFNKKYQLGDNPLQTNRFSLIFDQYSEGEEIQELYKNVQKIDKNMGDIEEQDQEYEDEGKQWNQQI